MATDTQSEVLTDVETALDIDAEDAAKIKTISLYIKLACKSVALVTAETWDSLPGELSGVVTEMALAKFAKRGDEGKTSSGEEGLSASWNVDDLAPYMTQLKAYKDAKDNGGNLNESGMVMSFD